MVYSDSDSDSDSDVRDTDINPDVPWPTTNSYKSEWNPNVDVKHRITVYTSKRVNKPFIQWIYRQDNRGPPMYPGLQQTATNPRWRRVWYTVCLSSSATSVPRKYINSLTTKGWITQFKKSWVNFLWNCCNSSNRRVYWGSFINYMIIFWLILYDTGCKTNSIQSWSMDKFLQFETLRPSWLGGKLQDYV